MDAWFTGCSRNSTVFIAPWKATFKTKDLFAGPVEYVLGASGHIAGVINPATSSKYGYWTNPELHEILI